MAYEYITKYDSPNYSPRKLSIQSITIHWWGDPNTRPTFNGVVNWLCQPRARASAHYVVEAGRVACIVACKHAAWHAGNWQGNHSSIGIECNPRMSAGDLETVAELIADLRKTYGNLPLVPHKKWTATACPGTYAGKLAWLDRRAREIAAGGKPATTKPAPKRPAHHLAVGSRGERVRALQMILRRVVPGHYTEGVDGIFGNHTRQAVVKLQAAQGLSPDGIVGDKTISALAGLGWYMPPTTARSKYPADWLVYGDKGDLVKHLQKCLLDAVPGLCEHANVDGDYGLWTLTSMCRFQRAFGLTPDGMCGPKTEKLLDRLTGETKND